MKKILLAIFATLFLSQSAFAVSKKILDLEINETIEIFTKEAKGGADFLKKANGYLVIPNLFKAGFVVGGEYGEGGMVIDNKIVEYYKVISASIGLQAGAQKKSVIIAFLTPEALADFRKKNKWEVGIDGSIVFVDWDHNIDLSTIAFKKAIVAFAFNGEGLMAGISLDGSVFTKIEK